MGRRFGRWLGSRLAGGDSQQEWWQAGYDVETLEGDIDNAADWLQFRATRPRVPGECQHCGRTDCPDNR